jgi:dipeptidyl aminopeptidase/acylaminoacyl peptidase/uncharacterized protein (DUF885 family)
MSSKKLVALIAGLSLWTCAERPLLSSIRADDPPDAQTARADDQSADEVCLPPGDPWYEAAPQQRPPRPNPADRLVFKARITPHWYHQNGRFWYRNELAGGASEFVSVDAEQGKRQPAFDHDKLAAALSKATGKAYSRDRLPFEVIEFADDLKAIRFKVGDITWKCDLGTFECSKSSQGLAASATAPGDDAAAQQRRRQEGRRAPTDVAGPREGLVSPDGKWTAFIKNHNVFARAKDSKDEIQLSDDGKEGLAYGRLTWSPDSEALVAFKIEPGDHKEVYLVQSSPTGGGRAKLQTRRYPLPGDKFAAYEINLFDVRAKKQTRPKVDRIDFGIPQLRWRQDGRRFTYEKVDRGHQRFRLIEVDSRSGQDRTLIDEKSSTFIWTAHTEGLNLSMVNWLEESNEILYVSERDGWRHLYLIDAGTGAVKNQITKGEFVVRRIDRIDSAARQVWFRASGKVAGQDPYFIHHYLINFDGTGLVALTEGNGSHTVDYSPDRQYLIDTYSRVDMAPVHELRRASDGSLVCKLDEADTTALTASGWQPPEVFAAKGRDGTTDIWGIICRPKGFDPGKKYPVIEQIYAGPHGSFVPKTFSAARRFASLTDLGFIVAQIDGMGTANRSKAFHDVCWHNLKDAGFPDRILWHQAVARKDPSYDLSRVGIYGTSAGGQNSTGALLFHPEFYKVGVSACGCHDNRMDKASWNEQWMGYPVGPWYGESSNIDNAHGLAGKLLLIVGEMDTNVPPESTMRLVDALIKAGKDFDLLVVPNANHGMGGAYGERRMREFFVRHLLDGHSSDRDARPARDSYTARASSSGPGPRNGEPAQLASSIAALDLHEMNGDRSELRGPIERFSSDRGITLRSAPPATSTARETRLRAFDEQWLDRLTKLDFDGLSQDGKVDYLLFKNYLAHDLRQLDMRAKERGEIASLIPFAPTIFDLEAARRELKSSDWSKTAATIAGLAKAISETQRALDKDPKSKDRIKRTVANHALAALEDLRGTLRGWFGFYDGYDPLFSWWLAEPYKAADQKLQDYAGFLRQRLGAVASGLGEGPGFGGGGRRRGGQGGPGGDQPPAATGSPRPAVERDQEIVGNPIGREALLSELQYEMIAYTPEELIKLAETELAWCEAEMKKAAREMGHGDDWRAALEHVKNLHVEPGQQPALIRDLALEAIEYLDKYNLVTIPPLCRDSWRMTMMSPERQLVSPFFLGGESITVSYPTSTMPHEAKMMSMRGNNNHFSRATVFHEVIPGHHLQGFMTDRYKTYRRMFNTPFWGEGWALYWELLLWDRGFAQSPENKVGMLFWRMHRCARIIFSLSFHLEKMTPRDCIDLLVNRIGHERDNATAEVRRSFTTFYGPLYQAAYLLGGMQIRSLHRELVESGKITDRDFHDAILKENSIPIEMVRALLTAQKLAPDYTPGWKFYAVGTGPGSK